MLHWQCEAFKHQTCCPLFPEHLSSIAKMDMTERERAFRSGCFYNLPEYALQESLRDDPFHACHGGFRSQGILSISILANPFSHC